MKLAELAGKLNLDPVNPQNLKEFGAMLMERKQYGSAITVLGFLYQIEKNVNNMIALCKALVENGKPQNLQIAVGMIDTELNNLQNSQKDLFELRKLMGNAYTKQGDYVRAVMYYQSCVKMNRELDVVYTNLGVLHFMQKDYDAAGEYFKKALQYNMDSSPAMTGLGLALMENGHPGLALVRLNQALDADPTNLNAVNALIRLAFTTGNINTALKRVTSYLETDPMNVDIIYSCAALYYHSGDFVSAASELERALLINPEHQYSLELLGLVLAAQGGTSLANVVHEGTI